MIESDGSEDSLTTNDQYVKEQLAYLCCTEDNTADTNNGPKTTNNGPKMVRIIVDVFLPKHKTQQSFAISAVSEGPMIDDVVELADQLQIEQNLGLTRHDVPVTNRAVDLEEDKKCMNSLVLAVALRFSNQGHDLYGSHKSTTEQCGVVLLNLAGENSTTSSWVK